MAFDFNELNVQLLPELQQYCLPQTNIACICLTRPQLTPPCDCLSRPISFCQCLTRGGITFDCACVSRPVTYGCGCISFNITQICKCLTNQQTLCICNTLPIRSYPFPRFEEFEELRTQLTEALKQVDIQQRAAIPQAEAAFDATANELKRQLEEVEKQRAAFRSSSGGGGAAPAGNAPAGGNAPTGGKK